MLIHGGQVLDPGHYVGEADVLIGEGRVMAVQAGLVTRIELRHVTRIDAEGLLVVPGLVDLHAHLREPGFEYKETLATGTAAAAAGGFTTVCCMPNTKPVNDDIAVTGWIIERAKAAASAGASVVVTSVMA